MSIILKLIGDCKFKSKDICLFRDQHGKFYVKVDGITTQRRMTANEMGRYFLNTMHVETVDSFLMSEIKLKSQAKVIFRVNGIIAAIRFVREHRHMGLKEAKDFVEAL